MFGIGRRVSHPLSIYESIAIQSVDNAPLYNSSMKFFAPLKALEAISGLFKSLCFMIIITPVRNDILIALACRDALMVKIKLQN